MTAESAPAAPTTRARRGAPAGVFALAWRIARRELRGGVRGFRVFLACLAIGAAAITAIGTVRAAIDAGLSSQGAAILGGDAEVRLTYRYATDTERAWLDAQGTVSEVVDFRSMLVTPAGERALTQVKGVDGLYPLYGAVTLDPPGPLAAALAPDDDDLPGLVIDPVLAERLGLSIGDVARLGVQDFRVAARLERMPDAVAAGFEFGPPIIVSAQALSASGLIAPGTLFDTLYRIRTDKDPATMEAEAQDVLAGTGFRWQDRRNGAPGVSDFVDRLSAFLVLVGLTGLAVGGVGVSTAVRAYLVEKTAVIATLRTLGATRAVVFWVYLLQVAVLAAVGIVLGLFLGTAVPFLLAPVIEARLPVPAEFVLSAGPLAEAAIYSTLAAALFTLWPLAQTEEIRAATLFRAARQGVGGLPRWPWLALCTAILAALILTAAWLTGLWQITLWAAGGIGGAFLALILAAWGMQRLARWAAPRMARPRVLRFALGAVGGPGRETQAVVVALGLGLSVLAAVGQIDHNLRNAIATDLPEVAPSYFVVDIQPAQLDPLVAGLTGRDSVDRVETAPMLRGVITAINGRPAVEVAGDHWVLSGDRGITYAAAPPEGTTITAGAWWDAAYDGPPQISFAAEEAVEMGLALGDMMTVNVLGRDITAQITSFREVDFSTGGIGFILSMNPGALSGAPHTHIATVYSTPEGEGALLREVSQAYPNITMIRVRDVIARVSDLLGGIAAAVTYGALATLITGAIVLVGTAATAERSRIYEGAILKTLGATRGAVLANFALRSALVGLIAGAIALLAGVAGGWAVSVFVMDTAFRVDPGSAILVVGGGVAATLLTGLAFAWRPLGVRPARVLRAEG